MNELLSASAPMTDANPNRPIVTRKQAQQLGLVRYFPGSTCKHGHVNERATINGACLACARIKGAERYRADPDLSKRHQLAYRTRNRDALLAKKKARRIAADPLLPQRAKGRARELEARAFAASAGASTYASARACATCGTAVRFSRDGKCVECNRLACHKRLGKTPADTPPRRVRKAPTVKAAPSQKPISPRQAAIAAGAQRYMGRPCPHRHPGDRYAGSGGCVECCSIKASSDAKKAYDASYLKLNRDRILERTREYARRLPAGAKTAQALAWAKANPERRRAIAQNYKHRRRAQESSGITGAELLRWKRQQKKACFWCDADCADAFEVDHFVALSRGGLHEIENLVIACRPCNARKSNKDPELFMNEILSGLIEHVAAQSRGAAA